MGETQVFQPLTREDKVTVVLYRTGIVLSAAFMTVLAILLRGMPAGASAEPGSSVAVAGWGLQLAVGMSVFFIHLYIGRFKVFLKNLYWFSVVCFAVLLVLGKGSLTAAFAVRPSVTLLLLPLSGCLGFVTAKEAFCFKLLEGYLLAMLMPFYLVLVAAGMLGPGAASGFLFVIAALLVIFTLRKAFMPIAYDIGDKTAYR